jgi:hypothetical protein
MSLLKCLDGNVDLSFMSLLKCLIYDSSSIIVLALVYLCLICLDSSHILVEYVQGSAFGCALQYHFFG